VMLQSAQGSGLIQQSQMSGDQLVSYALDRMIDSLRAK